MGEPYKIIVGGYKQTFPFSSSIQHIIIQLPLSFLKQPQLLKKPASEQVLATSQKVGPVHNEEYVGTYPQAQRELEKMPLL